MVSKSPDTAPSAAGTGNRMLALLLAMAMFVLVVDTSLMNVSISAVVEDLDTTVSGVQSAIAHPEAGLLLRKLMTAQGMKAPPMGRTLESICITDACD